VSLGIGTRLGVYEIVDSIGSGGMGEVYRARDSRLGRHVALKILPPEFANDADRLARFKQEARVLAALNHPNIAQIFGFEDLHSAQALVLELVEGETLAERIARGPLPLTEAADVARQVALALEASHEAGVIHRDLKPSNIKLRADGTVKVLDFGLAKSVAGMPAGDETMTSPAKTELGVILGTAAYMAPEQAKGRPVDKRADIWAYGVVLFEMLAGGRLFEADSVVETIGLVTTRDPDWNRLPATTPPRVRELLARCLDRDPRTRLRDIGEARVLLSGPLEQAAPTPVLRRSLARRVVLTAAVAGLVGVTGLIAWRLKPDASIPFRQFELPARFETPGFISPDGSRLAFLSEGRLSVQWLDEVEPKVIAQVPNSSGIVFWSPDGRSIGLSGGGVIRTIPSDGGALFEVCKVPSTGPVMGVGWRHDGTIVIAAWHDGLYSVPATGGVPKLFVPFNPKEEVDFHDVSVLPDDRLIVAAHLLGDTTTFRVQIIDAGLGGGRRTLVTDPTITEAQYSATGHLLLLRSGTNEGLWALPFSEGALDPAGARLIAAGANAVSSARDGTLVYSLPNSTANRQELVWVTRSGTATPVPGAPLRSNDLCCPELSPNGRRALAVVTTDGVRNLVVRDLGNGVDTRLTFQQGDDDRIGTGDFGAAWFPNGDRVLYTARGIDGERIVERPANGTGVPRPMVRGGFARISTDGRYLIFLVNDRGEGRLRRALLASDGSVGAPERLLRGGAELDVRRFDLSPDGTLLAFNVRQASGQMRVFLTKFPSGDGLWQVAVGGTYPHFSPDGKELFFAAPVPARDSQGQPEDRLVAVRITTTPSVSVGPPTTVLQERAGQGAQEPSIGWFDVGPDNRFLMFRRLGGDAGDRRRTVVVQNWPELLRRQ
jgi:serine/threonine protein kinase